MKMKIIHQHNIVPMRTGQEQFRLAGVGTRLIMTDDARGVVYVVGAGGACMKEEEWEAYILLCDEWLNTPVDEAGGDLKLPPCSHFEASFTEIDHLLEAHAACIKDDEREEIIRQIRNELEPLKAAVLRAEEIWREERFPTMVIGSQDDARRVSDQRIKPTTGGDTAA